MYDLKNLATLLLLTLFSLPVWAEGIDLDCEKLAGQMVDELISEGLLGNSPTTIERAQSITASLCTDAEVSAQQQYEEGKQKALTDWLWQDRPETDGHRRLKRLKR